MPAGRRLAELLQRELPLRPVDVPSYAPDRTGAGEDLIGIRREVDAFAYLIASKAQRPPLAVGLFGDWGSGKSFFMHAVRERIADIGRRVADRPQAEVPFYKQVRQIEFNAWEYVRGTLWASLLDHIFTELDGRHIDLVTARRDQLRGRAETAEQAWHAQAREKARLEAEVTARQAASTPGPARAATELAKIRTERAQRIAERLEAAQAARSGAPAPRGSPAATPPSWRPRSPTRAPRSCAGAGCSAPTGRARASRWPRPSRSRCRSSRSPPTA